VWVFTKGLNMQNLAFGVNGHGTPRYKDQWFFTRYHIIVGWNVQQWTCNNVGGLIYNPCVNQMD